MNKTEKREAAELSDSDFMKAWTRRAKDLDEVQADCRWFRAEYDRREMARRIEEMPEAERDAMREALAQSVNPVGIESEEKVNG